MFKRLTTVMLSSALYLSAAAAQVPEYYQSNNGKSVVPVTPGSPLPVTLPGGGGGVLASDNHINVIIAITGVAVQFPSVALVNGLTCFSVIFSSNPIFIGGSNVSNQTAANWTASNGEMLQVNGQGWSRGISNANIEYINGTAGDGVTCGGN